MQSYAKIRPRRSSTAEWELYNPILLEGEMGIEYPDSGLGTGFVKVKFGDGITPWNDLAYAINPNMATAIHGGNAVNFSDIWLRADLKDNWLSIDPVLGLNELVYDQTYKCFKVGDGIHKFSELDYIGWNKEDYDWDFGDEDDNPNDSNKFREFGEEQDFDYNKLVNKPKINSIILQGDYASNQLALQGEIPTYTKSEYERIKDTIPDGALFNISDD